MSCPVRREKSRSRPIPLKAVKAIGKAQGASINDVIMTLCDIAVSRYFDLHDDTPDGPLVAYMPVNIRTSGGRRRTATW